MHSIVLQACVYYILLEIVNITAFSVGKLNKMPYERMQLSVINSG